MTFSVDLLSFMQHEDYLPLSIVLFIGIVLVSSLWLGRSNMQNGRPKYKRTTSRASASQANRQFLDEALSMKQNVINVIMFLEDSGSNREQMRKDCVDMMTLLACKFERMSSVPRFDIDPSGECLWLPIEDLDRAIRKCVTIDSEYDMCTCADALALRRAHHSIGQILEARDDEGQPVPLWRIIILSPTAVLFRIDHGICDGLSATTLLKDIGVKTSSKKPLTLSDMSPILGAIEKAGDLRIALLPLKLLWPPNLVRAISFLAKFLSLGKEPPNPMRPLPEDFGKTIPSSDVGTVYFPTMKVAIFKDIAKAIGNKTTINDVILLVLSITLGWYMDALDEEGKCDYSSIDKLKVLLPIANPLRPSQYGDRYDGLCNRMTPVIVPLILPRKDEETTPLQAIDEIKTYMRRVKKSNAPLFMTVINTILMSLISMENLKQAAKTSFDGVSCVYSAVPGPPEAISLHSRVTNRQYDIKKLHVVLNIHPVSMFQALSYDGYMFFNITLDTRSGTKPWILRTAFIDAVKNIAKETGVNVKWEKELASYESSMEWGGDRMAYNCD